MSTPQNPSDIPPDVLADIRKQLAADAELPQKYKTSDWIEARARVLARIEPNHHEWIQSLTALGLDTGPYHHGWPVEQDVVTIAAPSSPGVTTVLHRPTLATTSAPIDQSTAQWLQVGSELAPTVTRLSLGGTQQTTGGGVRPQAPPGVGGAPGAGSRHLRLVPDDDDTRSR